jgi:tRNA dimethylallyltransferase
MNTLIAIVGPTAVGKTGLSIALAEALGAEVVNADSRQVYRGMDIGAGKPSLEERSRVPHHVFDVVDPDADFSLALYLDLAREAIAATHARNRPVILVGGTGQYVWALLEGWRIPRVPPNPQLRRDLQERAERVGAPALHAELAALDPAAAAIIESNNLRRTIRALEVIRATGRPFSEARRAEAPSWDVRTIGLTMERQALYERIDRRVEAQIAAGWPEEVQCLLERGYGPDLPSFASLGYREMTAYVRGEASLEEARARIQLLTRRFARRQYAWFRPNDPRIAWIDAGGNGSRVLEQAMDALSQLG